jgi:putative MATE family efflux protein
MKKSITTDLTNGNILKRLLYMSLPTMVGFSFQMFYDIIDIFWISKISDNAIAGVTILASILWVVEALNEIIGTSSVSLISQYYGSKDIPNTKLAIEQTISFKFIMGLIGAIVVIVFLKPTIGLFTNNKEIVSAALSYGYLRILFLPMMFSSYSVNTALRSIGNSKVPMYTMIFSSLLNLVLDPIFIFDKIPLTNINGFNYGIFGAAIATVLSQSVAFLIGLLILMKKDNEVRPRFKNFFKLNFKMDKQLLLIGLPNGFETFLRNFFNIVALKFVSGFGPMAITSVGIGSKIYGFAFVPIMGLMIGGASVIGQNLGSEDLHRSEKTAKLSGIISLIIIITFISLMVIFGKAIVSWFTKNPSIIESTYQLLVLGSLGLIPLSFSMGLSITFSGSGYNFPFFISSLLSRWAVQISVLFIAIKVLHLPLIWIWITYSVGDAAEGIILFWFYKRGKWREKRVYKEKFIESE